MKIFIVGMPKSGRTTVAKSLTENNMCDYINCEFVLKNSFRDRNKDEHEDQYRDAQQQHTTSFLKQDPRICIENVRNIIKHNKNVNCVIENISSPKDFIDLFDYNKDVVVFLNRTDGELEFKDCENIGVSVIRDYCFWMSSAGLLDKNRWLEYNFKIPGEETDFVKALGSKNSVFIIRSINKVIAHLKDSLYNLNDELP